mmetsp:Transcript_28917/g.77909  ORF Transcript_28917/g.77909 Transcript_28917/m.77909 type:complete len:283 (+) Transcript_28917:514-1362(+)
MRSLLLTTPCPCKYSSSSLSAVCSMSLTEFRILSSVLSTNLGMKAGDCSSCTHCRASFLSSVDAYSSRSESVFRCSSSSDSPPPCTASGAAPGAPAAPAWALAGPCPGLGVGCQSPISALLVPFEPTSLRRGGNRLWPQPSASERRGGIKGTSPAMPGPMRCWAGSVGSVAAMLEEIMPSSASACARTSSNFLAVKTSRRGTQLLLRRSSTSLMTKRMREARDFSPASFSSVFITSSSFLRVSAFSLLLRRPPAVVIISQAASMLSSGGSLPLGAASSSSMQ